MRKMYSENQVKRKALEALNVEVVEDENYSLEFNDPIKFNENLYDKNGNEISGGGSGGGTTLYTHIITATGSSDGDSEYSFDFTVVLPYTYPLDPIDFYDLLTGNNFVGLGISGTVRVNDETTCIFITGANGSMYLYNPEFAKVLEYSLSEVNDGLDDYVRIYQ